MAGLLELLNEQKVRNSVAEQIASPQAAGSPEPPQLLQEETQEPADRYIALKAKLQAESVTYLNENYDSNVAKDKIEFVRTTVENLLIRGEYPIPKVDQSDVVEDVVSEIIGLGPLDRLLKDQNISEIMVNGPYQIYVEERGILHLSGAKFKDTAHELLILDRIVSPLGRHIDESSPMVDARLQDGSRVNAIIPPLALNGPTITIRKFPTNRISAQDLIAWGSASPRMMLFLEACVKGKLNVIVSGGTGSGKTTLLGVLSAYIPDKERIVTIEDAAELQLQQIHVVRLESRPANIEGKGRVAIKDLVVNALRMRPDRIIVGECRGGEALDMLQAMNTGHDGSLTTGHANSPRDMMARLETMVMMAGMDLPEKAIRGQIASAINIVVQQARLRDGSRKITSISEITGMEGTEIVMQDIFRFRQSGTDENGRIVGEFVPTGIRPTCIEKLKLSGCMVTDDWFSAEA
ncbi:CpaF family protein [Lachnoclostridium sp. Marseille-P6806]|uniref:CpaF family protein n=1 Tax=Lachnoclostridium sp. Marseille-P6806 TaxID=2364793 RepID=UPI001030E354|nr:CpaF family protein [Lachnoclostridium sp. Marseille-P6806]